MMASLLGLPAKTISAMESNRKTDHSNEEQLRKSTEQSSSQERQRVTHNLDTGEDEPLPDLDDENIMDFGSGSGGGSAGDGGAS
jgi:hypothetical protein